MTRHLILVDACVAAAHFAAKTTNSAKLRSRSTALFTGASPDFEVKLLIPNFCIAEVFAVFEKYRWGKAWNSHVSVALTPQQFQKARASFRGAIHNGAKLLQVELDRYHILCVDLISPINNAYKIKRKRKKPKNVSPAKTYDMLIVAMGVWLKYQFAGDHFTIVTGDERLALVADRAKSAKRGKPMRDHLTAVAKEIGLTYGPSLYPEVIDLVHAKTEVLQGRFPNWDKSWL